MVDFIAAHPNGEEMTGTGGTRKVRFARPREGKRGGYRIVTFSAASTFHVVSVCEEQKERFKRGRKERTQKLLQLLPET